MGYSVCSCSNKWDNATEYLFDHTINLKTNINLSNVFSNIDKLFKPKGITFTREETEHLKNVILYSSLVKLQRKVKQFLKLMRSKINLKSVST